MANHFWSKITHRQLQVLIALIIMTGLGLTGWWFLRPTTSVIPLAIRKEIPFPIYVPAKNSDFTVDFTTVSYTSGILVLMVTGPENKRITITEQAKPKDFDFGSLKGNSRTDLEFNTDSGQAYVVSSSGRTSASLVTDETWVLLQSPQPTSVETMEALVRSLQQIDRD